MALLEVFHQLHCLVSKPFADFPPLSAPVRLHTQPQLTVPIDLQNVIRMYTWWQVDKYPGIPDGLSDNPLKNRMHVDHCIESLRIALQCWGDVTPLLIRLGGPIGFRADFNTHHRCRNFDKLEDWIDNNWTVL